MYMKRWRRSLRNKDGWSALHLTAFALGIGHSNTCALASEARPAKNRCINMARRTEGAFLVGSRRRPAMNSPAGCSPPSIQCCWTCSPQWRARITRTARERQAQGIANAKAAGVYRGRPTDEDRNAGIAGMLRSGMSWSAIQAVIGCSRARIAKVAKRRLKSSGYAPMDEMATQIVIGAPPNPGKTDLPPVEYWRGTRPIQAARRIRAT
jgi:hypothetical protein